MKNFIKTTALFLFVLVLSACSKDHVENQEASNADLIHEIPVDNSRKKIKIDVTFTSNEGCDIHIVGDLDVDINMLLQVTVNGFEGTVTFSGGGDCPNGSLTFGKSGRGPEHLEVSFDKDSCKDVTTLTWDGPKDAADILNEELSNIAIVDAIKANCQ